MLRLKRRKRGVWFSLLNDFKLFYKLYRNKLPPYCIPHYGAYHQNLRNNHIRQPAIRCDFKKNNSKYQMHFRLRELASPSNPPLYLNIDINDDMLSQSLSCFAKYVISKYIFILQIFWKIIFSVVACTYHRHSCICVISLTMYAHLFCKFILNITFFSLFICLNKKNRYRYRYRY